MTRVGCTRSAKKLPRCRPLLPRRRIRSTQACCSAARASWTSEGRRLPVARPGGRSLANSALWTIVNNRLMHEPRRRASAARRTAMGKSRKEILRCVK